MTSKTQREAVVALRDHFRTVSRDCSAALTALRNPKPQGFGKKKAVVEIYNAQALNEALGWTDERGAHFMVLAQMTGFDKMDYVPTQQLFWLTSNAMTFDLIGKGLVRDPQAIKEAECAGEFALARAIHLEFCMDALLQCMDENLLLRMQQCDASVVDRGAQIMHATAADYHRAAQKAAPVFRFLNPVNQLLSTLKIPVMGLCIGYLRGHEEVFNGIPMTRKLAYEIKRDLAQRQALAMAQPAGRA